MSQVFLTFMNAVLAAARIKLYDSPEADEESI